MEVEVRDAVEADAETLGAIVDLPADVLRNVVHDRTVRLAVTPHRDPGPNVDAGPSDAAEEFGRAEEDIHGFVAFDVEGGTVHVTQLAGDADVSERLLAEPIRFAVNEGLDVALIVPESDTDVQSAAEAAGFDPSGQGPRFDGEQTTKYSFRPE